MGYNCKNIKASNLSEDACQKSCESKQNCGSYGQRETYFKGPLLLFSHSNSVVKAHCFNYASN